MSFKLLPDLAQTFLTPFIFPSLLFPPPSSFLLLLPCARQVISHNLPSPLYRPAACRRQSVCLSHSAGRTSSASSFPSLLVFVVFSSSPPLPLPSPSSFTCQELLLSEALDHLRVFIVCPRRNWRRLYFLFAPRPESCPWA